MVRKDLALPGSPRRHLISVPVCVVLSSAFLLVSTSRAQDVAEAARQEQAKKESQQKKSKHVYTEEDLKRSTILTPEDREQVQAKKNQTPAPTEKPTEAIDAQATQPQTTPAATAPSQPSLGEVARAYRKQKELQNLKPEQSAQFHLPFANQSLAAPKPPVLPAMRAPSNSLIIVRPAPRPPVDWKSPIYPKRRSPFARPSLTPSPAIRSPRPSPNAPAFAKIEPTKPAAAPEPTHKSVQPIQPQSLSPTTNLSTSAIRIIIVQRGDSLWKLAEQNLGAGLHWRDLLAANPAIVDPNHINAGTKVIIPSTSTATHISPGAKKITVRPGDSLWKLAQTHLGHGASWTCIAQANPSLTDPQHILAGQKLHLPATCSTSTR